MHKFMRAIGFGSLDNHKRLQELLTDVILNADRRSIVKGQNGALTGEFCKDFAKGLGIAVCGEIDEEQRFTYEYYYPYLEGSGITSCEDVSVERHAEKESYAGVCDDLSLGVSIIFYVQNVADLLNEQRLNQLSSCTVTLRFSGLSTGGKVLLPVIKGMTEEENSEAVLQRTKMIQAARDGDEEAIENLTLEDMDIYSMISRRIADEDVFSIVSTYFMPYGVECDHYSILGEILEYNLVENSLTEDLCIDRGEP